MKDLLLGLPRAIVARCAYARPIVRETRHLPPESRQFLGSAPPPSILCRCRTPVIPTVASTTVA